ncbi:MAG: zinc-ribbon domain-containing protein [Blautia sp.]|nr:zinc-ribbon domain-containing protein [Lachnoclostridium sp.]MCM1212749.1 zinc-ribbon domain-containing protein [Blautia sp.]
MFCGNCGKEIKEGAAFCGYCGKPVHQAETVVPKDNGRSKKMVLPVVLCCVLISGIAAGLGFFVLHKAGQEEPGAASDKAAEAEPFKEAAKESGSGAETVQDIRTEDGLDLGSFKETSEEDGLESEPAKEPEEDTPNPEKESGDEAAGQITLRDDQDEVGVHTYELIVEDVTWGEAYDNCLARGGHLVRINSDEEYQAILRQIASEDKGNILFWLGGIRSSIDSKEYRWVYEDGAYGNKALNEDEYTSYWLEGEPSYFDESGTAPEMYMDMFYVKSQDRWVWNDVPEDIIAVLENYAGRVGYICEYEN